MLGLKGGLWVCRKSQKISTASDQYFLSYVKKTTGGGQIDPPPAGIGLIQSGFTHMFGDFLGPIDFNSGRIYTKHIL